MSAPEPPRPPAGHPADASEWAEYLRRYDRYLDLYEQQVKQNDEYNRQLAEAARVQAEGNGWYEQWMRQQRQAALWCLAILGLLLAVLGAVAGVAALVQGGD
jgi:hypothetical protein